MLPKEHVPHACLECGSRQLKPWEDRCKHRRACEARQMLKAGVSSGEAATHAQRLKSTSPWKPAPSSTEGGEG
jgi:hypothetical protein